MTGTISLTAVRAMDVAGIRRRVVGTYNGPASYVAGGDPINADQFKLGEIEWWAPFLIRNAANATVWARYSPTTGTLIMYDWTGTEITAAVDLSGYSSRTEVIGK